MKADTPNRNYGSKEGDSFTVSWLQPKNYALFEVPISKLRQSKLYLVYKYEWEVTRIVGPEGESPVSYVSFNLDPSAEFAKYYCGDAK
jgi:hypothetical protein